MVMILYGNYLCMDYRGLYGCMDYYGFLDFCMEISLFHF